MVAPFLLSSVSGLINASPINNEVAMIGDSRVRRCTQFDGANYCEPNDGWSFWLRALTGQRIFLPSRNNYGIGGDTIEQTLARFPYALDECSAGLWIVFVGTNSIALDVPASDCIAQLEAMKRLAFAKGRQLLIVAEMLRGSVSFPAMAFTASRLDQFMQYRNYLLSQQYNPGCYVADNWPDTADRTTANSALGYVIDTVTKDGLHENKRGSYAIAKSIASVINQIYPPIPILCQTNADVFGVANQPGALNANPLIQGTTGALTFGTGQLGDVWSNTGTAIGLTVAYSKVNMADGTPAQQIVISGGPSTGTSLNLMRQTPVAGNMNVGDLLEATARIQVLAGHSNLQAVGLQIQEVGGLNRLIADGNQYDTTDVLDFMGAQDLIYRIDGQRITTTNIRYNHILQVPNGVNVSATILIAQSKLSKAMVS